jgi:hypothetical protein
MAGTIYMLTIVYAIYVIDFVEGARFVDFLKDSMHIDIVQLHQKYRHYRDSLIKVITSALPVNVTSAT